MYLFLVNDYKRVGIRVQDVVSVTSKIGGTHVSERDRCFDDRWRSANE